MKRLLFVLVGVVMLGVAWWFFCLKPLPFSSESWKREQGRLRMVDDLLRSDQLIGLTTFEIEELLGPNKGSYYVGSEFSVFPFSTVLLHVEFEDGICTRAYRHNKF